MRRWLCALLLCCAAIALGGCEFLPRGGNPSQEDSFQRQPGEPPRRVLGIEVYDGSP